MSYVIKFAPEVEREITTHVRLANRIWREAAPDFGPSAVHVAAGNYSGYGSYIARCRDSGVIEFSTGNEFSALRLQGNLLTYSDREYFLGTLMHELGHHAMNTATHEPWSGLKDGGDCTHLRASWIWVCRKAWVHFHGAAPSHKDFVRVLRSELNEREVIVDCLSFFNPYCKPPTIEAVADRVCQHCDKQIAEGKRSDAKFCSASCRVGSHNARQVTALQPAGV